MPNARGQAMTKMLKNIQRPYLHLMCVERQLQAPSPEMFTSADPWEFNADRSCMSWMMSARTICLFNCSVTSRLEDAKPRTDRWSLLRSGQSKSPVKSLRSNFLLHSETCTKYQNHQYHTFTKWIINDHNCTNYTNTPTTLGYGSLMRWYTLIQLICILYIHIYMGIYI